MSGWRVYRSYSDEDLDLFVQNRPSDTDIQVVLFEIERRRKLKQEEANQKRDQTDEDRHKETIGLGKDTLSVGKQGLNWSRVAGVAGIVAVALAGASLAVQIYFSKSLPSTPVATSPVPSPQTAATISESPAPVATASSATPSPLPTATEGPIATSQDSPTPKPASTPQP